MSCRYYLTPIFTDPSTGILYPGVTVGDGDPRVAGDDGETLAILPGMSVLHYDDDTGIAVVRLPESEGICPRRGCNVRHVRGAIQYTAQLGRFSGLYELRPGGHDQVHNAAGARVSRRCDPGPGWVPTTVRQLLIDYPGVLERIDGEAETIVDPMRTTAGRRAAGVAPKSYTGTWAFMAESPADLVEQGWNLSDTSTVVNDFTALAADQFKVAGVGQRWSWATTQNLVTELPPEMRPTGHVGCIAAPIRVTSTMISSANNRVLHHNNTLDANDTFMSPAGGDIWALTVGNTLQGASDPYTIITFHYFCCKSDMSASPYTGELWIDENLEVSGSRSRTAAVQSTLEIEGATSTDKATIFGGVAVWSDFTDPAEDIAYHHPANPNNDGTNVGTWGSSEATDWEALESPVDSATFTEELTPNSGDRVEVLTDGGAGETISDIIEYTPVIVHGVTLHGLGQGTGFARVLIGDGTNETSGTAVAMTGAPTKMHESAPNTPTGPAWTGGSSLTFVYEFD